VAGDVLCAGDRAVISDYYDDAFYQSCDSDQARQEFRDAGYNGAGYYFWDETQSYCYGPYESALKCHEMAYEYAEKVLGHVSKTETL